MLAIQVRRFGGPEVLEPVELPTPQVPEGALLLDVSTAGVNYADVHNVENSYVAGAPELPFIPGVEVIGHDSNGRRRAALVSSGGYAEQVVAWPALTFDVDDALEDSQAAGLLLQGLSAWHLLRTMTHVSTQDSVVIFAGAGGVGGLAVQLARAFGAARVIAVASTPAKRAHAISLGATAAVDAEPVGLRHRLVEANDGAPVDVILEMTGGATFTEARAALGPLGRLVVYGMAGRVPPPPISPREFMSGSQTISGFWLGDLLAEPARLRIAWEDLSSRVLADQLTVTAGGAWPLEQAGLAHRALGARDTVGKLILTV